MDEAERAELLDTAVRAFHQLRQRMSEEAAMRRVANLIMFGEEEPPCPLTPEQLLRAQDVLEELRRLQLRH